MLSNLAPLLVSEDNLILFLQKGETYMECFVSRVLYEKRFSENNELTKLVELR